LAHTDPLDESILAAALIEVQNLWTDPPDEYGLVASDPSLLTFGRTFQIWLLSKAGVEDAAQHNRDVRAIAQPSGTWHHELWAQGAVAGSAISRQAPDAQLHVESAIYQQPRGMSINPAVAKLEQLQLPGDPLIRLLYAPAYHVYALWLIGEGCRETQVLIADAGPWLDLQMNEIMKSPAFLKELARQESIPGRDIDSYF
jgi:hypothetical protein